MADSEVKVAIVVIVAPGSAGRAHRPSGGEGIFRKAARAAGLQAAGVEVEKIITTPIPGANSQVEVAIAVHIPPGGCGI